MNGNNGVKQFTVNSVPLKHNEIHIEKKAYMC